jgi:hypothetical protein
MIASRSIDFPESFGPTSTVSGDSLTVASRMQPKFWTCRLSMGSATVPHRSMW